MVGVEAVHPVGVAGAGAVRLADDQRRAAARGATSRRSARPSVRPPARGERSSSSLDGTHCTAESSDAQRRPGPPPSPSAAAGRAGRRARSPRGRARRAPSSPRRSGSCPGGGPAKTWQASASAPSTTPASRPPSQAALQRPDDERDARQGVDHARVDQVRPDEPAQAEDRRARSAPRPARRAAAASRRSPARSARPRGRVEVERLPGRHPGIEQVLQRVEVARLALAEQRQAAVEPGHQRENRPARSSRAKKSR